MTDLSVWERIPLLLHVGLHKTATTWLQKTYFTNADDASFQSYLYAKDIIATILTPHETAYDPEATLTKWLDFAHEVENKDRIGVISAEALSSYPFFSRFYRTMFAQRLAQTFPRAKILVTIREQDSIIHSMYGQFVRFGYCHSLEDFLARPPAGSGFTGVLEYEYYDFDRLYAMHQSLFGEDNVIIAPYELFTADVDYLNPRLSEMFGRPIRPSASVERDSRRNAGLSTFARYCLRTANRFVSPHMRWKSQPLNPNSIGYWADRFVPDAMRRKGFEKDRKMIREAVGDYYVPSNQRLSQRTGLDLGALGYRVGEGAAD